MDELRCNVWAGNSKAHMSTGSTKNDRNSSNSIVPLQPTRERCVCARACARDAPAIQVNFDEHLDALLPAQHDHDLLERKLKLVLCSRKHQCKALTRMMRACV